MKKFKLLGLTLLASSMALSSCMLLPPKKTDSDSSSQSGSGGDDDGGGEDTPVATDWTDAQKQLMKEHLKDVLIPFISGIWAWEWDEDDEILYGTSSDATVADAESVIKATSGWKFFAVDSYGDNNFGYDVGGTGAAFINPYENDYYSCIIAAQYADYSTKTEDTEWSEDDAETMSAALLANIPFFKFGSDYYVSEYDDFTITLVDYYNKGSLIEEYAAVLTDSSNGYVASTSTEGEYVKTNPDGSKITIQLAYFFDYGNVLSATFTPVITAAAAWGDITPLEDFEASVPAFTADSYKFYTHREKLYVEGVYQTLPEKLDTTYAATLRTASLLVDTDKGCAYDWNETTELYYGYDTDNNKKNIGFSIVVLEAEPSSTFIDEWPETDISDFLASYEITTVTVPELEYAYSGSFKMKETVCTEASLYAEGVEQAEYLSAFIEAMGGEPFTEEEIEEYALSYVEQYSYLIGITMAVYDPNKTYETAYLAMDAFSSWKKKVVPITDDDGETIGSYTIFTEPETLARVYVENSNDVLYIQVMTPATPVNPDLSIDMSEQDFSNADPVEEIVVDEDSNTIITFAKGNNKNVAPTYYDSGTAVRCYAANTITISSDYNIASIELTTTKSSKSLSCNTGEISGNTWTAPSGGTKSVTFTVTPESGSGYVALQELVIHLDVD